MWLNSNEKPLKFETQRQTTQAQPKIVIFYRAQLGLSGIYSKWVGYTVHQSKKSVYNLDTILEHSGIFTYRSSKGDVGFSISIAYKARTSCIKGGY